MFDRLVYLIPIAVVIVLIFGGAPGCRRSVPPPAAPSASSAAPSPGGRIGGAGPMNQPRQPGGSGFAQPGQWGMPGDRPAAAVPDDTLRP